MGSDTNGMSVGSVLFGKTHRALLALFYVRPEQSFYLRQVVRLAGVGQGTVQRELARWVAAGLLVRTQQGYQVYYQANRNSPVFSDLKALAIKTAGLADVLKDALAGLSELIILAFIHGSVAEGRESDSSDVDVVIVGDVDFGEVISALRAGQEIIGREVNPTVYSEQEFRKKITAGNHFLGAVKNKPKIYLIGGERELKRLGT